MWRIIKVFILALGMLIIGFELGKAYIQNRYICINSVQYANYLTLPYKTKCIISGEEMHDWAMKNCPEYYDSICSKEPIEYVRYCYYHYYLVDNPDSTSFEEYYESFDDF